MYSIMKKRKKRFNPTREQIEKATEEYLAAGGEIDVLEDVVMGDPENYDWYSNRDSYDYNGTRRMAPEFPIGYF